MKRFAFPLASLLNARRLMEKEAKKALAEAEQRLQAMLDELAALERAFALASEGRRQDILSGIGAMALLQYDGHFLSLRGRIAAQHKQIRLAEQDRNRCLDALHLLYSEIKALESLREQQWSAYLLACEQERVREVDEFIAFHQYRALKQGGAR